MSVATNIRNILSSLPEGITLVAVTKTLSPTVIMQAYHEGLRDFGENRAIELSQKFPLLPKDIRWHYIGHLQRNKVRLVVPFVHLIHSIDSMKLLEEVEKEARRAHRLVDVLLQFHIAEEETKFGLDMEEAHQLLSSEAYHSMKHIRICGVMGMATFIEDEILVRKEFQHLQQIYTDLKRIYFIQDNYFREISMGMSGDYNIAIEEGSTMVRIGSAIFHPQDEPS